MNENKNIINASKFGLIGNLILLFSKGIIGFITNSQSMIADAVNSAGDIFGSFFSLVGSKIAAVPPDEDHNMGHGKAEYIFSFLIGISMILASLIVVIKSFNNLWLHNNIKFNMFIIIVCLFTIIIKLSLYIYTKKVYRKTNSIIMKSLYQDHRNDCLITTTTLISGICNYYRITYIDSIVGIGISLYIVYVAYKLVIENYNVLMDQSIDEESKTIISNCVYNCNKKVEMGSMSSIPIGNSYIIVLTILVNGDMSTREAHDITKQLQLDIKSAINKIDRVIIHVNPKD